MARSTRGNSPDEAPARALRSGSLGAGVRTDNGPGSRESARASRKNDAEEDPAAAANQDDDPDKLDDINLETMRKLISA